jgi:radical SAM superfamily enzyme YgiQ (UPF0313 family)
MNVLLVRPAPTNEDFGLGPFFRIEPLGMEYIGAALEARGHRVALHDLRFSPPVEALLAATRPGVVGVAAMHALEIDDVTSVIRRVRRAAPGVAIVVGGHSAAAYPGPFVDADVTAICLDDGERAVPALVDAIDSGRPLEDVPGWLLPGDDRSAVETAAPATAYPLDDVPVPARHLLRDIRHRYACLHHRPAFLVETARGCPFRCTFCSVWQLFDRDFRARSIGSVVDDMASVGSEVFIADDLFWHQRERSRELGEALLRRGLRKDWLLVQSRVDLVASHADLLETWRPMAREFDIFFGLESATNEGLAGLRKDTTVDRTSEAIAVARELGYGVTGNFVIDPAWREDDFEQLWSFVDRHRLGRAGFTVLTPLPGTAYFEELSDRIRAVAWAQFDMHHLLWEPALGVRRFFELYCETWRRSVLNLKGDKKWWHWFAHAKPRHWAHLTRVLLQTQKMLTVARYLDEHRLADAPGALQDAAAFTIRVAAGCGRDAR